LTGTEEDEAVKMLKLLGKNSNEKALEQIIGEKKVPKRPNLMFLFFLFCQVEILESHETNNSDTRGFQKQNRERIRVRLTVYTVIIFRTQKVKKTLCGKSWLGPSSIYPDLNFGRLGFKKTESKKMFNLHTSDLKNNFKNELSIKN